MNAANTAGTMSNVAVVIKHGGLTRSATCCAIKKLCNTPRSLRRSVSLAGGSVSPCGYPMRKTLTRHAYTRCCVADRSISQVAHDFLTVLAVAGEWPRPRSTLVNGPRLSSNELVEISHLGHENRQMREDVGISKRSRLSSRRRAEENGPLHRGGGSYMARRRFGSCA